MTDDRFSVSQPRLRGIAVGAGYFSHYQYEAWQWIPEVRIVTAVNRNVDRVRDVAAKFGVPRIAVWSELPALLDVKRPDFIDIITRWWKRATNRLRSSAWLPSPLEEVAVPRDY